ncbi:MAG: hypothetical protein ISS29_05995 [Candidatus Marinimicrobia bacterium]|nr:hypothetical protein [Candidatus Neomarinimicrobiota bacterium]
MIPEFIRAHRPLFIWLASLSALTFLGTILMIPVLIIRMLPDFFDPEQRAIYLQRRHPVMRFILVLLKNILGLLFFFSGFVMLFMLGQGLLTMLIGLSLINFPGKRNLERYIIQHPRVLPVINSLRKKAGKEPLRL